MQMRYPCLGSISFFGSGVWMNTGFENRLCVRVFSPRGVLLVSSRTRRLTTLGSRTPGREAQFRISLWDRGLGIRVTLGKCDLYQMPVFK